jgi:TIR domain
VPSAFSTRVLAGQEAALSAIFISYRRDDARADAGRLARDLQSHLADTRIFRDIDTVEPGVDFATAIETAVTSSDAFIAIIGPRWISASDKAGARRLDDPDDYVRLEIEMAIKRDVRVIPLLVGGAAMPSSTELPPPLAKLARRNAYELSESRWDYDVQRLAEALAKVPGIKTRSPATRQATSPEQPVSPAKRVGVFAGAVVLSGFGLIFLLAGLIDGEMKALLFAAVCLGGAWWLFTKR